MDIIKGGFTNYGQAIGILMLDTKFPRIPGDIGNALTYSFPVKYKIVKGAYCDKIMGSNIDNSLLNSFILAAQELENEGCLAITTSCGFLAGFQRQLADSVNIPVFTSALTLVPFVWSIINHNKSIGIFTERASFMNEYHFNNVGWSSKNIPVNITGMPEDSPFPKLFIGNQLEGNLNLLKGCMEEMTIRHMNTYKNTGAIVFECTNFGPFSKLVQDISGVPVFGINQLVEYINSCICIKRYY